MPIKIKKYDLGNIPILHEFETDFALEPFDTGFIPVSKIDSWQSFHEYFAAPQFSDFAFRGHKIGKWDLVSSFQRLCNNPKPQELQDILDFFRNTVIEMELSCFELNDDDLWGLGRHHGLLTPLLDWSNDHNVALYFAFEDNDNNSSDNPYCSIYCFNKELIKEKSNGHIRIINSDSDANVRVLNQNGIFTITEPCKNFESYICHDEDLFTYFRKIYVKREDQRACLNQLDSFGINKKKLYPHSIEGAVEYCNIHYQKFRRTTFSGCILQIRQRVIDKEAEFQKIAEYLVKNNSNVTNETIDFASRAIYELKETILKQLECTEHYEKLLTFIEDNLT
ncbi:hypothetical protein B1207_07730 [Legionella quinlivanii]|uniref:FRG domain-containing protein n=1 Tax=Legionella quinlivanii TaxID=45073 RepID=A0A364LJH3_9GAMM|nr:FRG domain-containing protein [Legionella quinlivanii]RAP36683.1 hypothetical protein B1207_07730 [Legionella quinlivanii]